MTFVLRQIHTAGKSPLADEATMEALVTASILGNVVTGDYLEWSDPNAKFGMGDERWTSDVAKAQRFPTRDAAMECWRAQSTLVPRRPDGKPNRPLTAWSVSVEEVPS